MSDFTRIDENHAVVPVKWLAEVLSVYYKYQDGRLVELVDDDLDDDLDQDYEVGDDFLYITGDE